MYTSETKRAETMYGKLVNWKKRLSAQEPIPKFNYNEQKENQNAEKKLRKIIDTEEEN